MDVTLPTRRQRVLLAEDDEQLRAVIREVLAPLKVDIAEAASGAELLQMLAEDAPFDLVVSDVRMPWMTGLQVAISLRGSGDFTPLIVMSAFGSPELRRSVLGLGNAVFLEKPVEPAALSEAAARVLRAPG